MNHEGSEVKIKDIPPILDMLANACSIQYILDPVHFTSLCTIVTLFKFNQGFLYVGMMDILFIIMSLINHIFSIYFLEYGLF